MNCKNCGREIGQNSNFCPACGAAKDTAAAVPANVSVIAKNGREKYSSIFFKYFLLLILLGVFYYAGNIYPVFFLVYLGALAVFSVFFCRLVGRAMDSVNKKNWWPLGLLVLVPCGYWITFFVVRNQLKPADKWGKDLVWLIIILIIPVTIAIAGIIAGMVLVSMGGARSQARDARRQADMRQLAAAQEMWRANRGRYYTCGASSGDCLGAANNYPASIGDYLSQTPADPYSDGKKCGTDHVYCAFDNIGDSGADFCYYAKLENGGFYIASTDGTFKRDSAPDTMADCLQRVIN